MTRQVIQVGHIYWSFEKVKDFLLQPDLTHPDLYNVMIGIFRRLCLAHPEYALSVAQHISENTSKEPYGNNRKLQNQAKDFLLKQAKQQAA